MKSWRVEDAQPARVVGRVLPEAVPGGLVLDLLGVPHQQVRPAPVRHSVGNAIQRVVGLILEPFEDVVVVLEQLDVHRLHVAASHQPIGGVTGE